MYNKIILIGNLTKDPELRYTPQGTPVTTFRMAVNSKYKQAGDVKQETLYIDIVVFGKQAEACSKFLHKGSPVLTEGKLVEKRWEKDGQQKSKFEVTAQSVRFLPRGGGAGNSGHGEAEDVPLPEGTDTEPF